MLRQMIVEHAFGTIKRGWGVYFFLTKRKVLISAEISLSFLAYNLKRAINILGSEEILRKLKIKKESDTGISIAFTFKPILFYLKKPPSLKVVMAKWFYLKNRNIC